MFVNELNLPDVATDERVSDLPSVDVIGIILDDDELDDEDENGQYVQATGGKRPSLDVYDNAKDPDYKDRYYFGLYPDSDD